MSDTLNANNPDEGIDTPSDNNKPDPTLKERLVRKFLDSQFAKGADGVTFYNETINDNGSKATQSFKDFHATNPKKNEKTIIESVDEAYMYREIVRAGILLESKRQTLSHLLRTEFDISDDQSKILEKEMSFLPLDKLSSYLGSRKSRNVLMESMFEANSIHPNDALVHFTKMLSSKNLTDEQRDMTISLLMVESVTEKDVDKLLQFFPNTEDKQSIIHYFLPTVTLGEISRLLGWSEERIRKAVESVVRQNEKNAIYSAKMGDPLTPEQSAIIYYEINPNEIIVPPNTDCFKENDIERLLKTEGRQAIAKVMETHAQEVMQQFATGNNQLGLKPDKEGRLLPDFIQKLREIGIEHPENFAPGGFIRGAKDGRPFCFQIVSIEDDPEKNRETKGVGECIKVRNILTYDGNIDANWKTKGNMLSTSDLSYGDMYSTIKTINSTATQDSDKRIKLLSAEDLDKIISDGSLKETTIRDDIHTLDNLNTALSETDPKGPKLEKGSNFQVGKPDDKDFMIYEIKNIGDGYIDISAGGSGEKETLSFAEFAGAFRAHEAKRLPVIKGPEDFLALLKSSPETEKNFQSIEVDHGNLVFGGKNHGGEHGKAPIITRFDGHKNTICMFDGLDPAGKGWHKGEWDDKPDKDGKIGYKDRKADLFHGGWGGLLMHFLQEKVTPVKPPEEDHHGGDHSHEGGHHGGTGIGTWAQHYFMHNWSMYDIGHAIKAQFTYWKDLLHHGSEHRALDIELKMGKLLGYGPERMMELRGRISAKKREGIDKYVKALMDLSGGQREAAIIDIVKHPSHADRDKVQGVILALIKKNGTLYPGSLAQYRGKNQYIAAFMGIDPSEVDNHWKIKEIRETIAKNGYEETEILLIQEYTRWLGGEGGGFGCDAGLWGQIAREWTTTIASEEENGEKQGDAPTYKGRRSVAEQKAQGGEYSQLIGVMKTMWGKGGSGVEMQLPIMWLILSDAPGSLHKSQMNKLYNFYGSDHYPFPALLFLKDMGKVDLFRNILGKLCEGSASMKQAYNKIETARKNVTEKDGRKTLINNITQFWEEYGDTLHKQLVMSEDPTILYKAKHENDVDYKTYVSTMEAFTDHQEFNPKTFSEGFYKYKGGGASSGVWNAQTFLTRGNAKIDNTTGDLRKEEDPGTKIAWEAFRDAVADVRNLPVPTDDPVKKKAFQFDIYQKYHKAYWKFLEDIPLEKIKDKSYMKEISKAGRFSILPSTKEDLEGPAYKSIVQADFERYINKSNSFSFGQEGPSAVTNPSEVFGKVRANTADILAANDAQMRKRA